MAATPSTPSPSTRLRDPPTPRYGSFYDEYEPFAPRKSARLTQRPERLAQTPPPQDSIKDLRTSHSSPPTTIKKVASTHIDPLGSPPPTAQRQHRKKPTRGSSFSVQRASGLIEQDSTDTGSLSSGYDDDMVSTHTGLASGMLPTPSKTPNKKKTSSHIVSGISAAARTLFSVRPESIDEVMPTPRKKSRKRIGNYTLVEEEETPIEIFTDSHERVPEVDASSDNPFYVSGPNAQSVTTRRTSKRRKINIPGEGEKPYEEVEKRDDGLIYVFRGKKMFRKFTDDDGDVSEVGMGSDSEIDAALNATVSPRLRGPLTRSSVKPKLLFSSSKPQSIVDEEEAPTDIEELSGNETPVAQTDELLATPTAPKFAPRSPPTTTRSKRSDKDIGTCISPDFSSQFPFGTDGAGDSSPPTRSRGRGGKISPFDTWKRTKATTSSGTKRSGDTITRSGGDNKRLRGNAA